jgi:hypothetical protein
MEVLVCKLELPRRLERAASQLCANDKPRCGQFEGLSMSQIPVFFCWLVLCAVGALLQDLQIVIVSVACQ